MLKGSVAKFSIQRGFSLIELMVSVVIGMIVVLGAVSLIVAIDRSNSENIQATRVHQELRALASVIGDEIKRSRHLHDTVAAVGQGATANGTFDFIDTSQFNTSHGTTTNKKWSDCIVYGYQDTPLSDGTVNAEAVNNYQAIYRTTTNGIGSVVFAKATAGPADSPQPTMDCSTDGTALNSPQIDVTALKFACVTTSGTNVISDAVNSASCNEIDITIEGKLLSGDIYTSKIKHSYVQQVFIRSGAVKTT